MQTNVPQPGVPASSRFGEDEQSHRRGMPRQDWGGVGLQRSRFVSTSSRRPRVVLILIS